MDSDDAKGLLQALVLSARLTQADTRARFTRSELIYGLPASEGDSRSPSSDDNFPSSAEDIDPSNFFEAPPVIQSSGAHLALRHAVTKRLAEHPRQFASLSAVELRDLGRYFAFTERPELWNPVAVERERPEIVDHVLTVLKKVDRAWCLSLPEGRLGFGRTGAAS
jgi:hypothetical protein